MSVYRCLYSAVRSQTRLKKVTIPISFKATHKLASQNDGEEKGILENYGTLNQISVRNYGKHSPKGKSFSSTSSSDSDAGKTRKKGLRGQSEFWRQKMRTHHMAIDLNNDGVVSWEDFEELIKRFSALGNLPQNDMEKLSDALRHVWEEEWGASGDPYAFIGYEHFLKNMEHVVNTKELRKKVASPLEFFFNAVDWDSSGEISIEEFKTFFKCLNLPEESAIEAFRAIDINGDGRLSKQEFIRLGIEFFLSEDETSPSKLFWGPLAN